MLKQKYPKGFIMITVLLLIAFIISIFLYVFEVAKSELNYARRIEVETQLYFTAKTGVYETLYSGTNLSGSFPAGSNYSFTTTISGSPDLVTVISTATESSSGLIYKVKAFAYKSGTNWKIYRWEKTP